MTVTYLFEFGHIFSDEFAGELIVTHRKKKNFLMNLQLDMVYHGKGLSRKLNQRIILNLL